MDDPLDKIERFENDNSKLHLIGRTKRFISKISAIENLNLSTKIDQFDRKFNNKYKI